MEYIRHHRNLIFLFITTTLSLVLAFYPPFHELLLGLKTWGYIGAFFAGMLFVSTFTITTGAMILLIFAEGLNPIILAIIAGAGGVIGDLIIFRFIKGGLSDEVSELFHEIYEKVYTKTHFDFGAHYLKKIVKTKYIAWTLPIVGAIIIASPLPDELGVTLIGITKMKHWEFFLLTFVLNSLSVFLIITAGAVVKP